jgi:5-methylcytosine-specific restriction endonuclease McrA
MHTYTEQDKMLVWNMGTIVPGYNMNQYRKDRCNAWIAWEAFGDRNSNHGWEIDHIIPVSKGGAHHINNVQPLHWKNNAAKADGPLVCAIR